MSANENEARYYVAGYDYGYTTLKREYVRQPEGMPQPPHVAPPQEHGHRSAVVRPEILAYARVVAAQGATRIDVSEPGWHDEMEIQEFCMADGRSCVIGQVKGGYGEGLENLFDFGGKYGEPEPAWFEYTHGFDVWTRSGDSEHPHGAPQASEDEIYGALDVAWAEEIGRRRALRPDEATRDLPPVAAPVDGVSV